MSEQLAFFIVFIVLVVVGAGIWFRIIQTRLNPLAAVPSVGWPPGIEKDRLTLQFIWVGWVFVLFAIAGLIAYIFWYAMTPTQKEVFNRYAKRIDAVESQFRMISRLLPEPGSVESNECTRSLDPLPTYDAPRQQFNTEIVIDDRLVDPTAQTYGRDLVLSGELVQMLYWRHQPPLPFMTNAKARHDLDAVWQNALSYQYLVVYRVWSEQSQVTVEAFLLDLKVNEIVCNANLSAKNRKSASRKLLGTLSDITHGTFVK